MEAALAEDIYHIAQDKHDGAGRAAVDDLALVPKLIIRLESALLGMKYKDGKELFADHATYHHLDDADTLRVKVRKVLVFGLAYPEEGVVGFNELNRQGKLAEGVVESLREGFCKKAHQSWTARQTKKVRKAFFRIHHHLPNLTWHLRRYSTDALGGLPYLPPPPLGFCYTPDCSDLQPLEVGADPDGLLWWRWPRELIKKGGSEMPPGVIAFREYCQEQSRPYRYDQTEILVRACGEVQEVGTPEMALLPVPADIRNKVIALNSLAVSTPWVPSFMRGS